MFLILTLIILVASFNIISSLIMLVREKGSDIAILRTMGATKGAVMREHAPAVPARLRGDADVFQRGGVGQDVGDLIGAGNALLRDEVGAQAGDVLAI